MTYASIFFKSFNNFTNYYTNYYLNKTSVFQVPHHGSKKNWNPLPNILSNVNYFIVNHGAKSSHHPNKDVHLNIQKYSKLKMLYKNNETSLINYIITLTK